jgi:hypothetical protein
MTGGGQQWDEGLSGRTSCGSCSAHACAPQQPPAVQQPVPSRPLAHHSSSPADPPTHPSNHPPRQADREELAAWERASAAARSKGLFFKNLYTPDADPAATSEQQQQQQPGGGGGRSRFAGEVRGSLDPEVAAAARRAAVKISEPAAEEVGSPLRLWLFGYMAAILALVVGQGEGGEGGDDGGGGGVSEREHAANRAASPAAPRPPPRPPDLTTADPSYGLDALYGVLGLILGFNAVSERRALASKRQEQQERQEQPPP